MTIIAITKPRVKPTRNTTRHTAPFGLGILRSLPTYRAAYTAEDAAWLLEEEIRQENARFDAMADESAAMDRYELGVS